MKVIAFDMDGTLFDNSDILIDSYRKTVIDFKKESGIKDVKFPSDKEIFNVIGLPPLGIFKGLMPEVDESFCSLMLKIFNRNLVLGIESGGGKLYPGVKQVLSTLYSDRYRLIMASNGAFNYIEAIFRTHEIGKYFYEPIKVVDEVVIHDKSELVKSYLSEIKYSAAIMVGDRETDRDAAISNSIPFIGCSYGHAGNSEIEREQYVAHNAQDILKLVSEITSL